MKKFSSVFSCFHTDIMNKYIFPVPQKISGNFPENFLEIFRNIFFRKSYITTYEVTYYTRLVHCSLSWLNGRRYQEMVLQQRRDDALSLSLLISLSLLCTFALL